MSAVWSGWRRVVSVGALRSPSGLVLVTMAVAVVAAYATWGDSGLLAIAAVNVVTSVSFVVAAILLSEERDQRGTAVLFGLTGLCWMLYWAGYARGGVLPLLGHSLGPFFVPLGAWALLRFPEPRLGHWYERAFMSAALTWIGAACLAFTLAAPRRGLPASAWWPPTLGVPAHIVDLMRNVYWAGAAVLGTAYIVVVLLRVRRLRGLDRWVLTPVIVSAVITCVPVVLHVLLPLQSDERAVFRLILFAEALLLLAIPGALLVAVVRQRLARAAVADMVTRLGQPATTQGVQDALREALRDPGLEVLYWMPDSAGYVDSAGRPASPPARPDRLTVPVATAQGDSLAVVITDPSLERHRDLVEAAVAAGALAMENARLQASVRAQMQQVQAAHRRVAEAGVTERRRLERDLHDGAQQRLLGLMMNLATVKTTTRDPATLAVIEQARDALHAVLQELRDLAHGIHPAVLSQSGLGPALETVAERLPLPVRLTVPPRRFPPAVEATVYFVACETLANTVKHARADHAEVRIAATAGTVVVEVADDGAGCADPGSGTGLAGIIDRVRTLGGEVVIVSPPGAGTRVVAKIPCE